MFKLIYDKYEIHDNGDLFSLKKSGKLKMKPNVNRDGYCIYSLRVNGKCIRFSAHRLVAINFLGNVNNYPCVNHIDGNKFNNNISNLEWCTYSQNELHAYRTGLKKGVSGNKNGMYGKLGENNPNFGKKRPIEYINKVSKKVIDNSNGMIFNSVKEAALFLNINKGTLKCYLCGLDKNPTSLSYIGSNVPINQKVKQNKKVVLNTMNGIFYDSMKEAADSIGIKYPTLVDYLNKKVKNKTYLELV